MESDFYQENCQAVIVKESGIRGGAYHDLSKVRIATGT